MITLQNKLNSEWVTKIFIHSTHVVWMIALVANVNEHGIIQNRATIFSLVAIATFLEMFRWSLMGRQVVEIVGSYAHASAIDAANRDFLLLSWYVIPPLPPFKLLERYSAHQDEASVHRSRSQVFAAFWLKSEVTLPMIAACMCFTYGLYQSKPAALGGLTQFYPIACLYWVCGIGALSKFFSILVFSIFIRIFKGY